MTREPIQSVWESSYLARSFLVDPNRKLSLHGLLSLMQESAWLHASHLGHGYARTRASGGSWVVARQAIEMDLWPDWGDEVTVRTWLRPPGSVLVTRDFEFTVEGAAVGRAAAHWLTIDHRTRRPIRLPFPDNPALFRQDGHLSLEPEKLEPESGLSPLAEFRVCHSDLDMNGHTNNLRFAQWILDSLPLASHSSFQVSGYQTNFLAEARPGDLITIEGANYDNRATQRFFRGWRTVDETVIFTARLLTRPT